MPRRPRRRPDFDKVLRTVRLVTLLTLVPFVTAIVELGHVIPPIVAALLAIVVASTLLYGIAPRIRAGFDDRPRAWWIGALAMPVFDAAWTGALFSPVTTGLIALAALPFGWSFARVVQVGSLAALATASYGVFVRRRWIRTRTVEVVVDGLPESLDGYRIAHLSDLHVGSTLRAKEAMRFVRATNAAAFDLVAITGDIISTGVHFHDEVASVLGALRAKDGVVACLGNHDYYEEASLCAKLDAGGVRVLRNEGQEVEGGLFVAGVEDLWRGDVDLDRALERRDGRPTVLLAHNPDFFPEAAKAKVDVVLSGHTHAGQVAVPFFAERWGLARFTTRFHAGVFRDGPSTLVVSAGMGTTGPTIRLGAAPEVVEVVLRRG